MKVGYDAEARSVMVRNVERMVGEQWGKLVRTRGIRNARRQKREKRRMMRMTLWKQRTLRGTLCRELRES